MKTIPRLIDVVRFSLSCMTHKRIDDEAIKKIERVASEAVERYRVEHGLTAIRWRVATRLVGPRLDVIFVDESGIERNFEDYERALFKAAGIDAPFG